LELRTTSSSEGVDPNGSVLNGGLSSSLYSPPRTDPRENSRGGITQNQRRKRDGRLQEKDGPNRPALLVGSLCGFVGVGLKLWWFSMSCGPFFIMMQDRIFCVLLLCPLHVFRLFQTCIPEMA
jgi:hypothetical protein